ncbi:MAG: HD domain-containing protein [Lachnospiraceae bacterium]|nr:HD domain-containing protein [Lachnospiraceae bacterium]
MSRLSTLREYVDKELLSLENDGKIISACSHLYGVSLAATMIAKKRNEDPELSAMAAMLHDLHAYKSGSYADHAHKGAELARTILQELDLTDEKETDIICSAIYHHDDKLIVDQPMDEVLKDADVIHHCMNDFSKPVKEKEQKRFEALQKEFDLM